jgi:hypothetical protein
VKGLFIPFVHNTKTQQSHISCKNDHRRFEPPV